MGSNIRFLGGYIRMMEKKMETTIQDLGFKVKGLGFRGYSPPPYVDRIWGIWGSYYNIPKAIFYLLKRDYRVWALGLRVRGG